MDLFIYSPLQSSSFNFRMTRERRKLKQKGRSDFKVLLQLAENSANTRKHQDKKERGEKDKLTQE